MGVLFAVFMHPRNPANWLLQQIDLRSAGITCQSMKGGRNCSGVHLRLPHLPPRTGKEEKNKRKKEKVPRHP